MNKLFFLVHVLLIISNSFSQEQFVVYFDTDKFETNNTQETRLQTWILENQTSKIVAINGYTDEDGTSAYNDTLAHKRVNFIFNKVKDKIAIRSDFKSRSFGENFNQSKDKAENRKATIYYLLEKDIPNENKILGIKDSIATAEVVIPENASLSEKFSLAKVGTKFVLSNIHFFQNTFATRPESQRALYDLLNEMQRNENLEIEIQGHICCVDKDRTNLSLERAKQIRRFLVYNGIKALRISVKGFGVSQPIYSIPEETEEQAAANRRVEILILRK